MPVIGEQFAGVVKANCIEVGGSLDLPACVGVLRDGEVLADRQSGGYLLMLKPSATGPRAM